MRVPNSINYFCKLFMELIQTFNTTLNDLINNLQKCYPEYVKDVTIITELNDTRPLQKFMKAIGDDVNKISVKDESFFDCERTCLDCDLSEIWKSSKTNEQNKNVIWKFMQTLVLIGTTVRSKSKSLEDFFENFDDENMFNDVEGVQSQMLNIVQKLLEENSEEFEAERWPGGDSSDDDSPSPSATGGDAADAASKYEEMFKNTKIGNLAKEIAEDIDMSSFENDIGDMASPDVSSIMKKLIGGGGLKNLVQSVAQKLKTKMESGDVNQEELVGEVSEMMEKMKKDKKFKKMFKSKDFQGMFKEMMKQKGQVVNDDEDFSALEEMCSNPNLSMAAAKALPPPQSFRGGGRRNGVRNRLRRKLEAKAAADAAAQPPPPPTE